MNQHAARPLCRTLVVNENVGLGKKRREALGQAELIRAATCILSTARTPAIKNCSLNMQLANVLDDCRHWNALATRAPNQGVVYIYKYMDWGG